MLARLQFHLRGLFDVAHLLCRHRRLTWEMAKQDIVDRYAGHALGAAWAVAHPLLLMGVYVFLFAYVFRIRVGDDHGFPFNYSIYVLSGLIPWLACTDAMARGTISISANANLVKQMVFPLEILPAKSTLTPLITQGISHVLLLGYTLAVHKTLFWMHLLLPVLYVLQFLMMLGISFLLAGVGAYFQDMKDLVQVFCSMALYAMPVLYLPDLVPEKLRVLLYVNPFSYMEWCYQDVCNFGRFDHPWAWGVFAVFSLGTVLLGSRMFQKVKPYFGSML